MNIVPFPRLPFGKTPAKQPVKSLEEMLASPLPAPEVPAFSPPPARALFPKLIVMHVGDSKPAPTGPPAPATLKKGLAALESLFGFMNRNQIRCVRELMKGEEKQFFIDKMIELAAVVEKMPATYDQRELGTEAIAHLHYFIGGCDWFIIEKDKGGMDESPADFQRQAYGYANLGDPQNAETGYISIREIVEAGAELDFHWVPRTLAEIQSKEGNS